MEFKKIKPRKILENETKADYECYLRDFYYHLNPPKPMDRYDFAYRNNLVDSAEVMDGENGKYVKYLEHYYSDYYRKLDKKINRTLKKYNKNKKEDNILNSVKNSITNKVANIKNNWQERKANQTKNSFSQVEKIALKVLSTLNIGFSAILLVTGISAIMNHNIIWGAVGIVVSFVAAGVVGIINGNVENDNNDSKKSKKKENMQLSANKKKKSKAKDKLLSLFTRKKKDKQKSVQDNESNDDIYEFDLNGIKEEKELSEKESEPFFDFDLSAVNTDYNEDVNNDNLEFTESPKFNNDMFEFDLNKVEDNNVEAKETAKVKVMKR